ncbi:hypothetical protein IscW_ISCW008980 [Ixodes scapularis]|uniref:Uncharacterized protein n=1 Tax=Ixodes scapularis TaxID=6945 RepID=B7Q3F3_IXOSC|nr:hypothetical protein IscW_ISCW008980 [Ixodes scapularis]|eukprot:XP_002411251.1 hypothetical protein IscW_ISCW008980 [Ixodes scapularis]
MLGASERFRTTRKVRLRFFRGVNRGEGASRSPTEQGEMYVRVSWCCVTVLLTPVHRHSFFKGAFTSEAVACFTDVNMTARVCVARTGMFLRVKCIGFVCCTYQFY